MEIKYHYYFGERKRDLLALYLSGTYCHKAGTRPPSCQLLDNRLYMCRILCHALLLLRYIQPYSHFWPYKFLYIRPYWHFFSLIVFDIFGHLVSEFSTGSRPRANWIPKIYITVNEVCKWQPAESRLYILNKKITFVPLHNCKMECYATHSWLWRALIYSGTLWLPPPCVSLFLILHPWFGGWQVKASMARKGPLHSLLLYGDVWLRWGLW